VAGPRAEKVFCPNLEQRCGLAWEPTAPGDRFPGINVAYSCVWGHDVLGACAETLRKKTGSGHWRGGRAARGSQRTSLYKTSPSDGQRPFFRKPGEQSVMGPLTKLLAAAAWLRLRASCGLSFLIGTRKNGEADGSAAVSFSGQIGLSMLGWSRVTRITPKIRRMLPLSGSSFCKQRRGRRSTGRRIREGIFCDSSGQARKK